MVDLSMAEAQVAYQALLEGLRSAENDSHLISVGQEFYRELCEDLAKAKREVELAWLNETTR